MGEISESEELAMHTNTVSCQLKHLSIKHGEIVQTYIQREGDIKAKLKVAEKTSNTWKKNFEDQKYLTELATKENKALKEENEELKLKVENLESRIRIENGITD